MKKCLWFCITSLYYTKLAISLTCMHIQTVACYWHNKVKSNHTCYKHYLTIRQINDKNWWIPSANVFVYSQSRKYLLTILSVNCTLHFAQTCQLLAILLSSSSKHVLRLFVEVVIDERSVMIWCMRRCCWRLRSAVVCNCNKYYYIRFGDPIHYYYYLMIEVDIHVNK